MQKYKQYCPVARASEILADRWTPLIVRELILGSHRFNEIERGLPGISRSLLVSRLRDLEDAGVVERLPSAQAKVTAYHLSDAGRDLKTVIESLGAWGVRWAFGEPRPEELDAGLLIWRIHQRIDRELLARQAHGRGVRLHRSSRPTRVVAARASRGLGLRDSPRVRLRSHRPCGSRVLLSCLVGTDRVRRRHSLSLGGGRRASRPREATSAVVHVEPDGAFRPGTRAHAGAGLRAGPRRAPPRSVTLSTGASKPNARSCRQRSAPATSPLAKRPCTWESSTSRCTSAAVAIEGGYYPYAVSAPVPTDTSPAAAVAAAAHGRPFCRTPRLVEMIVEAAVPSDLDDRGHCSHRLRHARAFIASLSVRHSQLQGLEEAQQRLWRLPRSHGSTP